MKQISRPQLDQLINGHQPHLLRDGLKGLEKESLRVTPDGLIAQNDHPAAFGSALTHPHITTDYSEALLEFITPPFERISDTLSFLDRIHRFVYQHLEQELLLATSMPCGIRGNSSIPIARYGSSNIGQMKHIYRRGLDYRYGRSMQVIAGIHFNYSVPEALWPVLQDLAQNRDSLQDFISTRYFGLIRNLQRYGWLILYLFGASPAICKAFLDGRKPVNRNFQEFDAGSLFMPYATSLRMSDIGYRSVNQSGLNISFNHLDEYVASLTQAIETPYPAYEAIGVQVKGEYRQLNTNILQIENEYYSSVRPKQLANSGEKPTLALKRRGVRYLELRSVDLNPLTPLGATEEQFRFMEALMLFCLLQDSPLNDAAEKQAINHNHMTVAYRGREPGLQLHRDNHTVSLNIWARELCEAMRELCAALDDGQPECIYSQALEVQLAAIDDPERTPSAQILAGMEQSGQTFAGYALQTSQQYADFFRSRPVDTPFHNQMRTAARDSLAKQARIEASDTLPFDQFLAHYFAQNGPRS